MRSGYPGIDWSQIIFAGVMVLMLIVFAFWAFQIRQRVKKLEEQVRDFRELEPEGYDEEGAADTFSEGSRMEADERGARQRNILEHES